MTITATEWLLIVAVGLVTPVVTWSLAILYDNWRVEHGPRRQRRAAGYIRSKR